MGKIARGRDGVAYSKDEAAPRPLENTPEQPRYARMFEVWLIQWRHSSGWSQAIFWFNPEIVNLFARLGVIENVIEARHEERSRKACWSLARATC
jgi:hypothetical protein